MTVEEIGKTIRKVRKAQGLSQSELAMIANTAVRFISELENGKTTCEIGKALQVAQGLGIKVSFDLPAS